MKTVKIWYGDASEAQVRDIAQWLRDGEIGIIPTDTMYAIVGDALNVKSVERLCRLKGINPDKSNLSIICSDISMAAEYSRIENHAFQLIKEYTPGAVTFLLRTASTLPRAFKGRKTVGVRIPDYAFCRDLATALGNPIITTSIKFDDEDYAINPALIAEAYEGKVDFMVEDEEGTLDESTIVDCMSNPPELVREGKVEINI